MFKTSGNIEKDQKESKRVVKISKLDEALAVFRLGDDNKAFPVQISQLGGVLFRTCCHEKVGRRRHRVIAHRGQQSIRENGFAVRPASEEDG